MFNKVQMFMGRVVMFIGVTIATADLISCHENNSDLPFNVMLRLKDFFFLSTVRCLVTVDRPDVS